MIQMIDAAVFSRMIDCGAAAIEGQKQQVNDLNVFPVPDGDTGTNMSMTITAAARELRKNPPATVGKAAGQTATAMLRGARGNSGVILSLLFRGIAKVLKDKQTADGYDFAAALKEGVTTAYNAIMKPTEGTILTVSRVSAKTAEETALVSSGFEPVLEAAIQAGQEALALTIDQNPVLKKAGVIDAGGKGYLIILEGMLAGLRGQVVEHIDEPEDAAPAGADFGALSLEEITFTYDTVFTVRRNPGQSIEPFRTYLESIGDSLVIGEDDDSFKVHVHTDTPGSVLTEAQKYGTLELAKIENMRTQAEELAAGKKAQSTDDLEAIEAELEAMEQPGGSPAQPAKRYGVVSVCAGDGLADLFRELGADGIVQGGQTMNPSTNDILTAVEQVNAETVFVLPNNKNIIMAAQQAVPLATRQVIVVETTTVPQGVTALLELDPDQDPETNRTAMFAATKHVTTMSLTYAARPSVFDGQTIRQGDYIALLEGSLFGTGPDMEALLEQLAQKVREQGADCVTIYYGDGVSESDAGRAAAQFSAQCAEAEVTLLCGGQPVYYYLISAE